jgi:hypothetical protein
MRISSWFTLSWLLVLPTAGCGESELSSPSANRLRALTAVYLDFAAAKGTGPTSEQQLRNHVENVPGFLLDAAGVASDVGRTGFVSERDGESFVIRYGIGVSQAPGNEAPVIAYEKTGKDGKRFVAFANGDVSCMDEVAAKELMHEKP